MTLTQMNWFTEQRAIRHSAYNEVSIRQKYWTSIVDMTTKIRSKYLSTFIYSQKHPSEELRQKNLTKLFQQHSSDVLNAHERGKLSQNTDGWTQSEAHCRKTVCSPVTCKYGHIINTGCWLTWSQYTPDACKGWLAHGQCQAGQARPRNHLPEKADLATSQLTELILRYT